MTFAGMNNNPFASGGKPNSLSYWPLVLALTLCLFIGNGCGADKKVKVDSDRYNALGEVMAKKTVELCGGKGSLVMLVSVNDYRQPTPYGQAIDAFLKALGSSITVAGTEVLDTPKVMGPGSEPLPSAKFVELLQKYSSADCLVSFVGVPSLSQEQVSQLPSPRPRVVMVVTHNVPTKAMFANQVICLAAVAKPEAQDSTPSGSAQEVFDDLYQLVTPNTASSMLR